MSKNVEKMLEIFSKYFKPEDVQNIVEAGSHKCEDTIEISKVFPHAHIFTFECNPATLPECREKIKGNHHISLIEKALSDKNGKIKFFSINKEKTITTHADGNQGASSLFIASGKYPIEKYVQDEIEVETMRLDSMKSIPDLMWLDAQGAELMILKGLGEKIRNVKFIQTEVEFKEQYTGQPLFQEVFDYLDDMGFELVSYNDEWEWTADTFFVNKKYAKI